MSAPIPLALAVSIGRVSSGIRDSSSILLSGTPCIAVNSLQLSVSSAGELHFLQRRPYDGLMNLAPVTSLPVSFTMQNVEEER